MKTQINLNEDLLYWEQNKVSNRYQGNLSWALRLPDDGILVVVYKDNEGLWRIDPDRGLGSIFDFSLQFKEDVSAKTYIQNKFLKWVKNLIRIRI